MAQRMGRHLPEEVHRALQARAAQHDRSMAAEVREILEAVIRHVGPVQLGALLADIGRQARLSDEEFAVFERVRGT